jgi:uncharacterized cupin superfamily protein
VIREAKLVETESGLVPDGDGWFVVNAREARWGHTEEMGSWCAFEGDARFGEFGINVAVIRPGQPSALYHAEDAQEDFLVLSGECLLVVEGEERRLVAWDYVHCPPWTEHIFVGAGDGPCVILMVGARHPDRDGIRYPANEAAQKHGAGVDRETTSGQEAYARFSPVEDGAYREGDLPDLR